MDGCVGEWMDGWTDGRANRYSDRCIQQALQFYNPSKLCTFQASGMSEPIREAAIARHKKGATKVMTVDILTKEVKRRNI